MRRHHILIPFAALVATLPLLIHGCSCGQDMGFHLQSWLDAAQQFRHGAIFPRWAFTPAYNAGEPRFVFYPPLSWLLGALLLGLLHLVHASIAAAPALYTFIAFTAAGFSMHRLARYFVSSNAALLASVLYIANPYMIFNAFERTAYAELLAAAWVPLLLLAVLRIRPTVRGISVPVALLWLTNAPAAVMGCYTLALLAVGRVVRATRRSFDKPPHTAATPVFAASTDLAASETPRSPFRLTLTFIAGTLLGLALPAFYLVPAAYERRYVQIAMAIIANMRFQDNFLFGHTADTAHNTVLFTASLVAVSLLLVTAAALIALLMLDRRAANSGSANSSFANSSNAPSSSSSSLAATSSTVTKLLFILTIAIAFLLVPLSTPLWVHLPELAFLQFPWRLLTILSAAFALAIALLCVRILRSRKFLLLIIPAAAIALCANSLFQFRQACEPNDYPTAIAAHFATHHGVGATDEYTPTDADNDVLRSDDPAWWLTADPGAFAPHTLPNPAVADPNFDGQIPLADTVSARAPLHLSLTLPTPEVLVLNLRDFADWRVELTTPHQSHPALPAHIERDDGLLAIALPAGPSTVDITWKHTLDQQIGLALTLLALLILALTFRRSRKIEP